MTVSENKKQSIYQLIKTGMSLDRAFILVELEDEEIALLREDPLFMKKTKFYMVDQERDLLRSLDDVIATNIPKGVSTEIRWKLERVNPAQWGTQKGSAPIGDEPLPDLIVTPAPTMSDDAADEGDEE